VALDLGAVVARQLLFGIADCGCEDNSGGLTVTIDQTACEADLARCLADLTACFSGGQGLAINTLQCLYPILSQRTADLTTASVNLGVCDAQASQCETDLVTEQNALATCQATNMTTSEMLADCDTSLNTCLGNPLLSDTDGDGVPDPLDRCPNSAVGTTVDTAGCSRAQFCATFDATTPLGARACRRADWQNDQPTASSPKDCVVNRGIPGPQDDRCVAVQ
jgi:hypothetical protein